MLFSLNNLSATHEREVYTVMDALGDFGGFNDGIILFPAIIMQIYSKNMFLQYLFSLLPIKQGTNSVGRGKFKKKCNEDQSPFEMEEADTQLVFDESARLIQRKNSWFLSLCYSKCFCKKNRGMRL